MIELLLFGIKQPESKPTQLVRTVIETKAEVEPPKSYTLEEKIKLDINNCEPERWIRADNAECKDKTTIYPTSTQSTARSAQNSSGNTYESGQCTWFVKNKRPDIPNSLGNATDWLYNAQALGMAIGTTPAVGAVGWTYGHVVYIESINTDGTVNYSDMNGRYVAFEIGYGTRPASYYTYIY